jgi:Uncharacterized protein conserved in bacteria (DUF2188)
MATRTRKSSAKRPEASSAGSDGRAIDAGTGSADSDNRSALPAYDAPAVGRVAGCVEILNVELVGAHFDRSDADVLPTEIGSLPTPDFAISVDWSLSDDRSILGCLLGFATIFEESEPYTVVAQFRLTYALEGAGELTDNDFEQFAHWNAVFNAWPYWREHVFSVINRAQLPRFIVPVMGVPRNDSDHPTQQVADSAEGHEMPERNPPRRVVQPNPEGGWDVKNPRGERASVHTGTQADAIDRAREILSNLGGGELEIRNRQGQIRDVDTVPHGNDPNPPRDRR